jgi:signal transduction histidine kinase/streptogramin lyase
MRQVSRIAALGCIACSLTLSFGAAWPDSKVASRWLLSQWQRRVWQIEDGLPHNYVTAIAYDSERYLLVGTQSGVARFDGIRFTPFPALKDLWIYSLLRASDGTLWAGTYQHGLYHVDGSHTDRWGAGRGFTARSVYSIVEDKERRIWFASENGLHCIDSGKVGTVITGGNTNGYAWQSLTVDGSGTIWFAGQNGLFRGSGGSTEPVRIDGAEGVPVTVYFWNAGKQLIFGTVSGLYLLNCTGRQCEASAVHGVSGPVVGVRGASDGALWVATWGRGIYRLTSERVEQLSASNGWADDFVRVIMEDAEHNVWAGTRGGGLTRFRATVLKPVGMPEGLGGNCASVVTGDGQDGVWLGTWRSGLFHWRNNRLQAQLLPRPELTVLITALAVDDARQLWIGSFDNLWVLPRFGAKAEEVRLPEANAAISGLLFSRKHELWVAEEGQGIFVFPSGDPRTSKPLRLLPERTVTALYEDSKGAVWIGEEQGLWRVRSGGGRKPENLNPALRRVTALHEDSKGRMWIASADGRILVYSGTSVERFRYANLPAPEVYSILEDGRGQMWFSTGRGLARARMPEIENAFAAPETRVNLSPYGVAEGMRSIECRCAREPQSWRMADGTLWVPTAKGFIQIDQARNEPLRPPKPVIEEVVLDGKRLSRAATVTIPPGRHDLEARFTAIRLGLAEGVRFRYRMAGLDPDWVSAGSVRVARYGQLPPGNFRLMVSARDASGAWSDAVSVGVRQKPYFYQTGWFRLTGLAVILGIALLLYRLRLRMIRARYAAVIGERNRIAREFHDTLLAGLSAVSWQIDAALALCAGHGAESMLTTARGMLRYCRDEARRAVGGLRDEPEPEPPLAIAIANTVRQMTEGSAVQTIFDIEKKLPEIRQELALDLVRICQEAVHNAMRHGHATEVRVTLCCEAGTLRLSIKDNGSGADADRISKPPAGHFGILGMRERASRFGGAVVVTSDATGTLVEAAIPSGCASLQESSFLQPAS